MKKIRFVAVVLLLAMLVGCSAPTGSNQWSSENVTVEEMDKRIKQEMQELGYTNVEIVEAERNEQGKQRLDRDVMFTNPGNEDNKAELTYVYDVEKQIAVEVYACLFGSDNSAENLETYYDLARVSARVCGINTDDAFDEKYKLKEGKDFTVKGEEGELLLYSSWSEFTKYFRVGIIPDKNISG